MVALALKQFSAIADSLGYLMPKETDSSLKQNIISWYTLFRSQIEGSRLGYPSSTEVYDSPYLETVIHDLANRYRFERTEKPQTAKVFLTHDIDYLYPTPQLMLKEVLGRRVWRKYFSGPGYIDSIEETLETDRGYLKSRGPTVFLASPSRSHKPLERMRQWIIDPSYSWTSPRGQRAKNILTRFDCHIGLHGSILSLSGNSIGHELEVLSRTFSRKISTTRQHWLHLPEGLSSLRRLAKAGVKADSTLGWNGKVGFRTGMARPFPIYYYLNQPPIVEIPLGVMDGVLFDELKLSEEQAFKTATEVLTKVKAANGSVALNWHDRNAHLGYGWNRCYKKILAWCSDQGFEFSNLSDIT
jgi:hypothetical protein